MSRQSGLRWLDDKAGDGLEGLLRTHHRRRLRRRGWLEALEPTRTDSWWAPRAQVRTDNAMDVLVDGASALPAMQEAIAGARRFVHIAGWHASPDFELARGADATALRDLLATVAGRVPVRLLLWAGPPVPAFKPTRPMVHAARDEFTRDSSVQVALDRREHTMHCHHEKIVVVDDDVAFVGGIDFTALQGDRYDEPVHPIRASLGWHDAAVSLRGPVVGDVAAHFLQRWNEVTGDRVEPGERPAPAGDTGVQLLRTVPDKTYDFAPRGEFSVLAAYTHALRRAEHFIYLENQFLWSPEIVDLLVDKLRRPPNPRFRVLVLLPAKPNSGADTTRGQLGRLVDADRGHGRLLAVTLSHDDGAGSSAPVYVHAKIGIVDDCWLTLGSANLNEHSLFNDTEVNVATDDQAVVRSTRLRLWAEHTERSESELEGDPATVIDDVWRPIAEDQSRRAAQGRPRTHRLALLPNVSRRTDRLGGPVRGLLVDG